MIKNLIEYVAKFVHNIKSYFERESLRREKNKYILHIFPALFSDYGPSDFYTVDQVAQTMERHNIHGENPHYAMAMFVTEQDYLLYGKKQSKKFDYKKLRKELIKEYHQFCHAEFSTAKNIFTDLQIWRSSFSPYPETNGNRDLSNAGIMSSSKL